MERFAPRYDPLAFTLLQMVAACVGFTAIALARGELEVPHGWTVWGALLVTGVFASALGYLVQTWAQRGRARAHGARLHAGAAVRGAFRLHCSRATGSARSAGPAAR